MTRTNILTVILLCMLFAAPAGFAQEFFVTLNAGYGLGSGTQYISRNLNVGSPGSTSYEGVYGSFGEGFKAGFSAGYMFTRNLGVDLGFSYWLGKKFEATYTGAPLSTQTQKWSGSGFVAVPSIVLSANMNPVNPYARFGAVFGLLKVKVETDDVEPSTHTESTLEESGRMAFGFAGAVGLTVPVGGVVDIFAEAVLHSVTYSPRKIEVTKFTVNGADHLASLSQKVSNYEDDWNSRQNTPTNSISQGVRRAFSSIGIVVGARVTL